jgi:F0F1-type ATP synthase assembly protein I
MTPPDDPKKSLNQYARYSGMAFQMMAIILAGAFGGLQLDKWLQTKPVFTVILSIVAVFLAIFYVTRDLLKKK